jgi:adenylosuccinate synthase
MKAAFLTLEPSQAIVSHVSRTELPTIKVVAGGLRGDEGKGKIIDMDGEDSDVIMRVQGGANAGHTVKNSQGNFALHLMPSGIFNDKALNIIGHRVSLDLEILAKEDIELNKNGVATNNLRISRLNPIALAYSKRIDIHLEQQRAEGIGTTGKGNGPTVSDDVLRVGPRVADLSDLDTFMNAIRPALELHKNQYPELRNDLEFDEELYVASFALWHERFIDRITDTHSLLQDALHKGKSILVEGAQGSLLDLTYGTYPNVTSSGTIIPGLLYAAGISPWWVRNSKFEAIGVFKAYMSSVGTSDLVAKMPDRLARKVRKKGNEYGTTTGRPRDLAYPDRVLNRYSNQLNGFTGIYITGLDTLSGMGDLAMCESYQAPNGTEIHSFQEAQPILSQCKPNLTHFHGWPENLRKIRDLNDLPEAAFTYVMAYKRHFPHADLLGVGVGPRRDDMIKI